MLGLFGHPFGNGGIVRACGEELAEGLVFDPGELEPDPVERVIRVVFTGRSCENGAAFVHTAGGDDASGYGSIARAAGKFLGKAGCRNGGWRLVFFGCLDIHGRSV